MTGPADCEVIGRWRIVSSDQWDRGYLDLVDPAFIDIGRSGRGELVFGAVTASLDLSYSRTIVFFTFEGCDEDNEVTGFGIGRAPRGRHARDRNLVPPWR
jgi:hypothetical protein